MVNECKDCRKPVKEPFLYCFDCNQKRKAEKESGQANQDADKKYNVSSLNGSNNNYSDKRQDSIIRQFALREAISVTLKIVELNGVKDLKSTDILTSAEALAGRIVGWCTK